VESFNAAVASKGSWLGDVCACLSVRIPMQCDTTEAQQHVAWPGGDGICADRACLMHVTRHSTPSVEREIASPSLSVSLPDLLAYDAAAHSEREHVSAWSVELFRLLSVL